MNEQPSEDARLGPKENAMLTYQEAAELMSKARNGRRKLANNTYLEERSCDWCQEGPDYHLHHPSSECDGCKAPQDHHRYRPNYAVRLHSTDVVTLHPDGSQTLNSGGWRTVTTKDRINQFSPVKVGQARGQWYVYLKSDPPTAEEPYFAWSKPYHFADEMRVYPNGRVVGAEQVANEKEKVAR